MPVILDQRLIALLLRGPAAFRRGKCRKRLSPGQGAAVSWTPRERFEVIITLPAAAVFAGLEPALDSSTPAARSPNAVTFKAPTPGGIEIVQAAKTASTGYARHAVV